MGDVLKVLTEASLDNLFVLTGLAFLAIAIIGNISGKLELGKGGRIAAALVGPCLVAGGLWMHSSHGLNITSLAIAPPQKVYDSSCPVDVNLQGIIDATGSGAVIYSFEYSDGTGTPADRLEFDKSDSKLVNAMWKVQVPLANGWARLKTLAPKERVSKAQAVTVTCQSSPAPAKPQESVPKRAKRSSGPVPDAVGEAPVPSLPAIKPGVTPVQAQSVEDSVQFTSISPKPGTTVPRGGPFQFNVAVDYTLVSADNAILSLSVAEIPASSGGCLVAGGELSDAAQVPITRGKHHVNVLVTWSGDTGAATKGRVYGKGYLSFIPMFWADNKGVRGERLKFFGTYANYCYPFGP